MGRGTDEGVYSAFSRRRCVDLSRAVVDPFIAGQFAECLKAIELFEATEGRSKFSTLYRTLCERYLADPPADFDGCIVLTEK